MITRREFLAQTAGLTAAAVTRPLHSRAPGALVTVYKSGSCKC